MPDIGNTLREARIRRRLSITDVENVTKIRSKYLEALEENDFEVLPGPTVVKGFLRSYAIFLKLDPELLLYEYRSQFETHREEIGPLRTEMAQQRRTQTSAERRKKRIRRTQRGYVAAALLAVVVIIVIAYFGARGGGKGVAVLGANNLPSSTSLTTSTTIAGDITTTSVTVEAAGTSTTVGALADTGADVTMVLDVTHGSCWLVVREDSENGAELYAGTLSAGGRQTFNSAKGYWVMAGIPEALSVSVNGTHYPVSGGAGTFVITASGVVRVETDSSSTTG